MPTAEFLRLKAKQCRERLVRATAAEIIAQLEVWASEFEAEAAKAEAVLVIVPPPSPATG